MVMVRRLLLALTLVALASAFIVPSAAAIAPTRQTDEFSFTYTTPTDGDAICDFTYEQAASGTDEWTFFADGSAQLHETLYVAHTNLDTHYTLTEKDVINIMFAADGSARQVGVFWHLRDANGKQVVLQAGQLLFDTDGNLIKFTPNINPEFAEVICPVLGGLPA
jgi:hypothetical protein